MAAGIEKILVIEPDAAARDHLLGIFQNAGYDAEGFATASEALESAHQNGADFVILDATVTAPSAREFVATLRGVRSTEMIRTMLLVNGGPAERAAAMDIGASDALSRPADDGEILARVRAPPPHAQARTRPRK